MSVKFFGQFLIEQGEIDGEGLRAALALTDERNVPLGAVCVRGGFLQPEDAERINALQRREDRPFGELAIEHGLLTREQLEDAISRQQASRLRIGEALVELGLLDRERLEPLLADFKRDQEPYQSGDVALPDALAGDAASTYLLDMLPKFCMRVARLNAKLSPPSSFGGDLTLPVRIRVQIRGTRRLAVTLACDLTLARKLAAGASGLPEAKLDPELIADGVGEFMNVVAGNAVSALERDGTDAELGPPESDVQPQTGFAWAMVTPEGSGLLVIEPGD